MISKRLIPTLSKTISLPASTCGELSQLEAFFSLSLDLLAIANFDGYFLKVNKAWTTVMGWTSTEMTSVPFLEFVHPEDRAQTVERMHQLRLGRDVTSFRNRYRCKSGKYVCIEWAARVHHKDHTIFAIARDRTSEIAQEEERRSLSELVSRVGYPVYVLSPKHSYRFVFVNEATCRHYGFSEAEMLTMCVPEIDPNFDLPALNAFLAELRTVGSVRFETVHRLSSGEIVPVEIHASHIQFRGEECIAGYIEDIRVRKHSENAQRILADNLARSYTDLERFSAVVAHDLRGPLRTMSLRLGRLKLKKSLAPDAKAAEDLAFVLDTAAQLDERISKLLDYSRSGKAAEQDLLDTNQVVDQVVAQLEFLLRESAGTVTRETLPNLTSSRTLLTILFQNLIENALRYRSTSAPRISISVRTEEQQWVFSVSDNGVGIDPEDQERIFKMFQRGKAARSSAGTGIGLSTCQKIVESLGGRIWVESEPGKGSTFSFSLARNITGVEDSSRA